ncbi:hypothetical protein [Kingella bonacorsii]|uniref:Predicted 3'-5' exonuclease PolB-like domain-containing protein n=1 Tax=Kingella bonacorsii TaxID=2796361 RepID=A0ABS1BQL7_9NEIS|nr:hypothetical protein [Kingella bonacorsii]MBK0395576.1 hypothetical protein [Kingella bonacorsii]MBK0397522.1 hypothetical protein [Kingella bonacorsii]
MLKIYLDIETIPDQRPSAYEATLEATKANFKAPGDLTKEQAAADLGISDKDAIKYTSKATMIAQWEAEMRDTKAPELAQAKHRKTALNGGYGQVRLIGIAANDNPVSVLENANEATLLQQFNQWITEQLNGLPKNAIHFIGHNIEWDLRFLYHRFVINRIAPAAHLIHNRYSEHLFDTMQAWAGYGSHIKLDELCTILNIPTPKDSLDGSQVWDAIQAGRVQEVVDYCARDVAATREVYRRLNFINA